MIVRMNRNQQIKRLSEEKFDLCIIGGGASGAGCALDAALRGLKVALVEKEDFAAETSSRSTKLVHGGVRYLEQAFKKFDFAQLRQVLHGLRERRIVLQNAPHLARPLGLVTPVFNAWESFYYSIGLKLYDWFAGRKSGFPASRRLNKAEALRYLPVLSSHIHSAVLYYDGQMDDARYALAIVQSAAKEGAVIANHLEALEFEKNERGEIVALHVQDHLSEQAPFLIHSRCFLNCAGPYADSIRLRANAALTPRIHPSKGVHLVLPAEVLDSQFAMLIPKTRDGRMVFALPYEGKTLLGTTDEPYIDLHQEPLLEASEISFLLETLSAFLKKPPAAGQISAGFGGIRPLVKAMDGRASATKSLLRDHEIEQDSTSGLISLLGGKWTTYRLMARDAIDAAGNFLGYPPSKVDRTAQYRLAGSEGYTANLWERLYETSKMDGDICRHLAEKYGGKAHEVTKIALESAEYRNRIHAAYPFIAAEVVYAVRYEMAMTLRDFMARRIRIEILDWDATIEATPFVAAIMGRELGWDATKTRQTSDNYRSLVEWHKKKAQKA